MQNNISIKYLFSHIYQDFYWKRVISVKEDMTLTELHQAIIRMLRFKDPYHLFVFNIGKDSLDQDYLDTVASCEEYYSNFTVGEIMSHGKTVYYEFDLSDQWIFEIKQTLNSPLKLKGQNYRIVSKSKYNPRQYSKI